MARSRVELTWASHLIVLPVVLVLGVLLGACSADSEAGEPCEPREVYGPVGGASALDLLFVIDNSPSMASAQAALAEELPAMMRALTSGDLDGDGATDFYHRLDDLHVGVISTDMGTGGFEFASCSASDFGDDGLLEIHGDGPVPGCDATYPSFLAFRSPDDAATLAEDAACLTQLGTSGCGVVQPFEAMLKALWPSAQTPSGRFDGQFHGSTTGHGDGANGRFRHGLLAVIELTNDDDCSVLDPELLNPESSVYPGEPNLRCVAHAEALRPIGRYVDALMAMTSGVMLYAPIVGVPGGLLTDPLAPDYPAILADPAMQVAVDPSDSTRQLPSCTTPDGASALPPRRHIELAQQLGAAGADVLVQSLCQGDLAGPLRAIAERISWLAASDCFASPLSRDDAGHVDCELIEVLSPGDRCADIPGRTQIGDEPYGDAISEVCRVAQLPILDGEEPVGVGWYADDFSPRAVQACAESQWVGYASGALPTPGTRRRFECAPSAYRDFWDIGSPCPAPGVGCTAGEVVGGRTCRDDLTCDPATNTLESHCVSDDDCATEICGADGRCTTLNCRE